MNCEDFFSLFLEELNFNQSLTEYYKFISNRRSFSFRKEYFCQRLQFIFNQASKGSPTIWDCGCGYGTTGIFLALNGIRSLGTTLEFYSKQIPRRKEYWANYGNMDLFRVRHEDLNETIINEKSTGIDLIILQDTLHHLEPLQDMLSSIRSILSPDGRLCVVEENGSNVIQNAMNYLKRGDKRIIEVYDEALGHKILMGNENIRSFTKWSHELASAGFKIDLNTVEYIRMFPWPFFFLCPPPKIIDWEQVIWRRSRFCRELLFFGVNFVARLTPSADFGSGKITVSDF